MEGRIGQAPSSRLFYEEPSDTSNSIILVVLGSTGATVYLPAGQTGESGQWREIFGLEAKHTEQRQCTGDNRKVTLHR